MLFVAPRFLISVALPLEVMAAAAAASMMVVVMFVVLVAVVAAKPRVAIV